MTIRSHYGTNVSFASLGSVVAAAGDLDFDGVPDYAGGLPSFGGNPRHLGHPIISTPAGRIDVWSGATGRTPLHSQWHQLPDGR